MAEPIRIGFVGAGFMGQVAHLAQYDRLDGCRVVALAEPRPRLAEEVARRHGIPRVYADHRALLAAGEVDAVVAAQPYRHHAAIVPDLLDGDVHLFTEKPLTMSVEAGERLADHAERTGKVYMVGYHKRSDPAVEMAVETCRRWRETDECGPLRLVRVVMPPGDWIAGAPGGIRTDEPVPPLDLEPLPAEFDEATGREYDAFVNYYIHQVNALRLFLGPYAVAYAEPTGVLMVARAADGACGVLEMTPWSNAADWQESITIGFERGWVRIDLPPPLADRRAGRLRICRRDANGAESIEEPFLPPVSAMLRQAENFLAAIRGERPAPCGPAEAVEDLRVARDYIRMRMAAGQSPERRA